jgi:hypothetical protein
MSLDLQLSFHALERNYIDLVKIEDKYFKSRKKVTYRSFGNWNNYILELTRLLHNYLSSYSSFVDCLRTPRKALDSKDFQEEFNKQLEDRHIEERTRFVKDLRNFSQHKQLPVVSFRLSALYLKGNETVKPDKVIKESPSLRVDDLLKWDRWSSFSKKFLEEQLTNEMAIMPIITEGQKAETEIYKWTLRKIRSSKQSEATYSVSL